MSFIAFLVLKKKNEFLKTPLMMMKQEVIIDCLEQLYIEMWIVFCEFCENRAAIIHLQLPYLVYMPIPPEISCGLT